MQQYLDLLRDVRDNGVIRPDRTGTGTRSVFGRQVRFDLSKGFPLLTTKKLHFKSIMTELLWFLRGDTNTKFLEDNGVTIWREWQDEDGNLGPVYGAQWRSWPTTDGGSIDQISRLVEELKGNPDSRRHIVCSWNVGELSKMALPPCHCFFQLYVSEGKLDCQLYQRSADTLLGVPYNLASYAALTMMLAQVTGLQPGEFIHTFGDLHLYNNHIDQANEQLSRTPRELPKLVINPDVSCIFDFVYEDFCVTGYNPHPAIKAPIAV